MTFILVVDTGRGGHKIAKRGIRVKSFVLDTRLVEMVEKVQEART